MRPITRTLIVASLLGFVFTVSSFAAPPQLWVYNATNFQVDGAADKFIALMKRAKAAGYDAIVVDDYKFGSPDNRPANYYRNLERARHAADAIGIEIIPCVMPVGYSNSLLFNDPNLAEGLPVRDCPMIVHDGKATIADADELIPAGDFEHGGKGFDFIDGLNKSAVLDHEVHHGGQAALRMSDFYKGNEAGNARVMKTVAVRPFTEYRLSVWIRTAKLAHAGEVHAMPLTLDGRSLSYANLNVKSDQDWTRSQVIFNSLDHDKLRIYVGLWSGTTGTFWLDDLSLRPVAGVNLLRREGCPLRVSSADGKTVYTEGKDYQRWVDPKMGRDPWPGEYSNNDPEPPLMLTPGSRIADGERLHVSYYHAVIIYDGQLCACLSDPHTFELMKHSVQRLNELLHPKRWFMSHDELRVAGWCGECAGGGKTAGQLLADNVRRCTQIIRDVSPGAGVIVWSDMFDPHHNAHDHYYLCASTLEGSWKGLDPSVMIANWNGGHRAESLKFFADRGHTQVVAGYYDNPHVETEIDGWRHAASGLKGVDAYMYTTWRSDYSNLERFAKHVRAATSD